MSFISNERTCYANVRYRALTLVRARGDDASVSPAYQTELRQSFYLVRADGTKISASERSADSIGGGGYTGEFFIVVMRVIAPALWRTSVAWLRDCPGRTISMKVGNAEVVAANATEVYGLLDLATTTNQQLASIYNRND